MSTLRMWFSKRLALPTILVLVLSTVIASPSPAAALGLGFTNVEIGCGSVTLEFDWEGALPGDRVSIKLYHPDAGIYYGYTVVIDDTNGTGSQAVDLKYGAEILDGWTLKLEIEDAAFVPYYEFETSSFARGCFEGSVGPSGTGDGEGEPIDSRSGETTESSDVAPAGDPDDNGRVQVP